jgi:hypothetical protein
MHNDRVKTILNKIDYNLKEVFENVEIKRLGNTKEETFEIKLSGVKNNPNNKAELVIQMTESTIYEGSLIWKYKTNPLNENSMYVTRTSTIGSMAMDVEDIVTENRFAKEYLESLLESINESAEAFAYDENIKNSILQAIESTWTDTDMGSGYRFSIDNPFTGETMEQKSYLDIWDSDEYPELEDWKQEMHNWGFQSFQEQVLSNRHIVDEFAEYSQRDEDFNESFDFDFDEEVVVEGTNGTIIDREKLVVESVEYNVYQVYLDGVQKSVFEYDIDKK